MFFPDLSGEGPVLEIRLLPDTEALEPKVMRQLIPRAPLYAQYAPAAIKCDREDVRGMIEALRHVGGPRRGLSEKFYEIIAGQYRSLVGEGEKHPVKALGQMHNASISAASKWLKEARRRGLIDA
jgi:hypothetical protein